MRVFNFEQWVTQPTAATESGGFVGVAIGPDSHESTVRVNDVLLQAGRVLPLRTDGGAYRLSRERIPESNVSNVGGVPSIVRLQLLAFECPSELVANLPRPTVAYSAQSTAPATGNPTRVLTVPFRGRRPAQILLSGSPATVTYQVKGLRYSPLLKASKELLLKAEADVAMSADGTYGFNIGGTDHEESWDALAIELTTAVGAPVPTWTVDVDVIGESGNG
jgi:hypothetical protein